jgi:hypothetical protein
VLVYFGLLHENDRSRANFLATFFHGKSHVLILAKIGLATFWAIFFTNSSGHPAFEPALDARWGPPGDSADRFERHRSANKD